MVSAVSALSTWLSTRRSTRSAVGDPKRSVARWGTAIAAVLATACTTAVDETGAPVTDARLEATLYPSTMSEICRDTADGLAALPQPSEAADRAAWAEDVARIFTEQATAFDGLNVPGDRRVDHRTLIETTSELAGQWIALGTALGTDTAQDTVSDIIADITALTLGRNELVDSMGLPACRSTGTGS